MAQTQLLIGYEVVATLASRYLAISLCAYCIDAKFVCLLMNVCFMKARRYLVHFVESIFELCFEIWKFRSVFNVKILKLRWLNCLSRRFGLALK